MKINRTHIAVVILVLFLASFSEATWTFAKINLSWIKVFASARLGMIFRQAGTPRAGEFVLPPVVQSGISLLRANRVGEYALSPALRKDTEIRDRFVEGGYPLHYRERAHYLLFLAHESPERKCSTAATAGGVVLVYCP